MKKRIVCLLLCLFMVVPTLMMAGCNNQATGIEEEEERLAMSLSMVMVTDESTTPEAVSAVQDALNTILRSKLKTQVIITTYTEDEYLEKLDEQFDAYEKAMAEAEAAEESRKQAEKEAKKRGETIATEPETEEVTGDETIMNDIGFSEIKYPEVTENEIDIFYLTGIENLYKYYEDERLAFLDEDLGSTSKKLADYIYPTFIDAGKIEGSTVAILNNHVIGEYTMLLVNKELADKYYYDPSTFTNLKNTEDFIDDMAVNEPDYTPFLEKVESPDFVPWCGENSLYGSDITANTIYGSAASPQYKYRSTKVQQHFITMKRFEEAGYFSDDPANDNKFAAAIVNGSLQDKEAYEEDYYVTVLRAPTAFNEDIYQGMFCISSYCENKEVSRAMEVLTLINTDPTVRNILQYGVEGLHYRLDNGVVTRLNDDYMMDLVDTGNTFIAYPEEGMSADVWEYGKRQNLDSTTYSLLSYNFSEKDKKMFDEANADIFDRVTAILENATYADLLTVSDPLIGYESPLDAVVNIARYEGDHFSSLTTVSNDDYFAARLNEWFTVNFG